MTTTLDQTILTLCDWCDAYEEKDESLISLEDGDLLLCSDCYANGYCEECSLCGDLMEPDELDRSYIAVMMDVKGSPQDVPAGIYEAIRMPYYTQNIIGSGWLWSDALRLIAPLEPLDDGDAPCGHLCASCILEATDGKTTCD